MRGSRAADLTVVIPTRDRWHILRRTLEALGQQTTSGFEVVVVVDGPDQPTVALEADLVLRQDQRSGPGEARNSGVRATSRPLVLFLGDDIIPESNLVASHLAIHERDPRPQTAALGRVEWHAEVGRNPHNRWLDWSSSQFDYSSIQGDDAGWVRFYSCNVSLKRQLFLEAGGFDPAFTFDYEDLDLAYRLHLRGMELRYAPAALGRHLHSYSWGSLVRRYESRGRAEHQMAKKHDWFEPWFAARIQTAMNGHPVSPIWPWLASRTQLIAPAWVKRRSESLGTAWYHQQLAAPFFAAWNEEEDAAELTTYLANRVELDANPLTDRDFRTGSHDPYLTVIRRLATQTPSVLDYGNDTGTDGLRLLRSGCQVSFVRTDSASADYLRWRLKRHGYDACVFDADNVAPVGFDVGYAFGTVGTNVDPIGLRSELEQRAELVVIDVPQSRRELSGGLGIKGMLNHATRHGLVFCRRFGDSYLIAYRPRLPLSALAVARTIRKRLGVQKYMAAERITGLRND